MKDHCYYKIKKRYKVFPSAYACLPKDNSQALTKKGWVSFDDINVDDEIMTFNMHNDCLEFQEIKNIHEYSDAKVNVARSGNTSYMFECTDNHEWVFKSKSKTNRANLYDKTEKGYYKQKFSDFIELNSNKHIKVSSKYFGGEDIILDDFFKYGTNWIEFLLNCSYSQREAWFYSAIVYDGNQSRKQDRNKNSTEYYSQSFGFKQKDEMHTQAVALSAFLRGSTVGIRRGENINSLFMVSNKELKNSVNLKKISERVTDVWCPEVENGAWVTKQFIDNYDVITITGNSGAIAKCRKNVSKKNKKR